MSETGTVLANDEVSEAPSIRGGYPVVNKEDAPVVPSASQRMHSVC